MAYEIVTADGGKSTIIDTETRESVLSIDTREVDGRTFRTPVFANRKTAEAVLGALNS